MLFVTETTQDKKKRFTYKVQILKERTLFMYQEILRTHKHRRLLGVKVIQREEKKKKVQEGEV